MTGMNDTQLYQLTGFEARCISVTGNSFARTVTFHGSGKPSPAVESWATGFSATASRRPSASTPDETRPSCPASCAPPLSSRQARCPQGRPQGLRYRRGAGRSRCTGRRPAAAGNGYSRTCDCRQTKRELVSGLDWRDRLRYGLGKRTMFLDDSQISDCKDVAMISHPVLTSSVSFPGKCRQATVVAPCPSGSA